ncbi:MAG TPA: hypothetical protein VGO00_02300 [Kofleriaceae bacterium]|nr:hypothetical protein [Kofleriaceae bacterium]
MSELAPELGVAMSQGRYKADVLDNDVRELTIAVGGRAWKVHLWEYEGWIRMCCPLVSAESLPAAQLGKLVVSNADRGVARFAVDDAGLVVVAAELPSRMAEQLLTFAALVHGELVSATTKALPEIAGRGDAALAEAAASDRYSLARHRGAAWTVDDPDEEAFGRAVTVAIDGDWVTIEAATEPLEINADLFTFLAATQASCTINKLTVRGDRAVVVARWPRKLMDDELYKDLFDQVALEANSLEHQLGAGM